VIMLGRTIGLLMLVELWEISASIESRC